MTTEAQKCSTCHALIDEEDLFCGNCGRSVPREEQQVVARSQLIVHHFQCDGCGASMSYDAATQSLRCPFCGSQSLVKKRDQQTLQPSQFIPFRIDRQEASKRLRASLRKGFWRPNDLARAATIEKVAAVFVPFWIFSARTHTYWTADSGDTPLGARGDWYPRFGELHSEYQGILVGASNSLTATETQDIQPFDLGELESYEPAKIGNVTTEQFTVHRKFARPLARHGLEQQEKERCVREHLGSSYRNLKVNTQVHNLHSKPVILPVWMIAYRYRDTLYRILLNGQTGRLIGQRPISRLKQLAVAAIVILAVLTSLAVAFFAR